jgi:hypothetical protein
MKVGTFVKVKSGASTWMKDRGYWINDWPESIDSMIGEITHDYTAYKGDDCHYEVALPGVDGCGIHPQWLSVTSRFT